MGKSEAESVALRTDDAARIYGLSAGYLGNLRHQGLGPKFFKIGRRVLYKREDFEDWLFSRPEIREEETNGRLGQN